MPTPEGPSEEENNASSPETVLSPEEVQEIEAEKRELYIYIFHKRESYWKDWLKYTHRYFALEARLPEGPDRTRRQGICERNIEKIINAYKERTRKRKEKFVEKWPYGLDTNECLPFLDGMDLLVKAQTQEEIKALSERHKEYCAKNDEINPSTPATTPNEEGARMNVMSESAWEGNTSSSESEAEA
ncbi:hypothetical protein UA08_02501 [Talaromyces atroroseus]|uniref:Uncharacterized protein n=1 Tax=Talaromyces atroroseus TaxID=1441469 RepID=A0A225AU26_TALAT|nr:hypothetical protein UA08_02501 [Talaromyces atroroseus]OKL61864.1 hypothetical protein UA08_02501 [Talaromyces atroroseus]